MKRKPLAELRAAGLYLVLTAIACVMLVPFVHVVLGGFKSQGEFISDPGAWLPTSFTNVDNYVGLFTDHEFGVYLRNSFIVSGVAVVTNVLFGSMCGYALAKLPFRGKRIIFVLVLGGMMLPYVAMVVPQFLIVVQLGLVDTLAGIVIPLIVAPLSVFIMRQYAESIPDELLEAARIDGAGEYRTFFQVFLPLTGPALATVGILSFLNSWNIFMWPLVVAQSQGTYTAPVGLAVASQASNTIDYGLLLAGSLVVLLPVVLLYLFLQRYVVQGVAATGIK